MDTFTLILKKTEDVADRTRMFVFEKPEGFSFRAGQYVAMRIPVERLVEPDDRAGVRSFSIATAPGEDGLAFVMREGVSGFKKTMWNLRTGDAVGCTGAVGECVVPDSDPRPIVLLAGGVGIAPARSMLRDAVMKGDGRKYALFYANRTLSDAAFHEEFLNLTLSDFTYIYTLSQSEHDPSEPGDERGYITTEMIGRYLPEWRQARYYVIGAPGFVTAMKDMLLASGIDESVILMDPFAGLESKK